MIPQHNNSLVQQESTDRERFLVLMHIFIRRYDQCLVLVTTINLQLFMPWDSFSNFIFSFVLEYSIFCDVCGLRYPQVQFYIIFINVAFISVALFREQKTTGMYISVRGIFFCFEVSVLCNPHSKFPFAFGIFHFRI